MCRTQYAYTCIQEPCLLSVLFFVFLSAKVVFESVYKSGYVVKSEDDLCFFSLVKDLLHAGLEAE